MTDVEFEQELETLNDSFNRVKRVAAEWHAYIAGNAILRPTTSLAYLFRPGSIVVKDTVALIAKVSTGQVAKSRIKSIYSHVKSCVCSLDEFITVPAIKSSCAAVDVRRIFDLIHTRLLEELSDSPGGSELAIPQNTGDKVEYREAIKKLSHRLANAMKDNGKLPEICNYPQARDYIIGCTRGQLYYKQCRAIQDAMEAYGWKSQSLLTFCKGGSTYDKKINDKRQTKVSKKKHRVARDIKGAWHDGIA